MVKEMDANFAPYAPASSVLAVIARLRERGLPEPLTVDALEQVGVRPSMAYPTHQALRFLGLIDEDGGRTAMFQRLRRGNSDEYPEILAEIVRAAYLPVFSIVDPGKDSDLQIGDAFRRYDPANQRQKMIRLYRGLCEQAGLVGPQPQRVHMKKPPDLRRKGTKSAPQFDPSEALFGFPQVRPNTDFRVLAALIQQLPQEGRWTADKRERWLQAVASAVDLIVDVEEERQMEFAEVSGHVNGQADNEDGR